LQGEAVKFMSVSVGSGIVKTFLKKKHY